MRSDSLAAVMVAVSVALFLAAISSTLDLPGFDGLLDEPDPTLLAQEARLAASRPRRLNLAAFSTSRDVFEDKIAPGFEAWWEARHQERVDVVGWYRGSRVQARAIAAGFDADVAVLAWEPDMAVLVDGGLVSSAWRDQPGGGMMSSSCVVAAVRPGNPIGIRDWDDLTRPGVVLLTPDPRTSGTGASILLSAYGAALRGASSTPAGDHDAASRFVSAMYAQVRVMDDDAEESLESFSQGIGNVALTTQQELTTARLRGQPWEQISPSASLVIRHPAAVVITNTQRHGTTDLAEAFLEFIRGTMAQSALAEAGFDPALPQRSATSTTQRGEPVDMFTVEDIGGWERLEPMLQCPGGVLSHALAAGGRGCSGAKHPSVP